MSKYPNEKLQENTAGVGLISPSPTTYSYEYRNIGSAVGFGVGLIYAFKVKSGFWKGWGYTILGSLALGGIGYAIGRVHKKTQAQL